MNSESRIPNPDKPVVALCYDFDKTLSPDNMQAQGYLRAIDYEDQEEFWKETARLARNDRRNQNRRRIQKEICEFVLL